MWRCTVLSVVLCCLGCNSYKANLVLPSEIKRVDVQQIASDSPALSGIVRDKLVWELSTVYEIGSEDPDLIITGSASFDVFKDLILFASLTFTTRDGPAGQITMDGPLWGEFPGTFAKKVKKLLTANTRSAK